MLPSVSVLMPVLNEESDVVDAISSVLAQEDCQPEVIVVDGRSADATRERVSALAEGDHRISLLDNPDVTIPAGLNVALEASRAAFVARVDGHTAISDGYLARATRQLAADPSLGGIGGRRVGVARTRVGRAIGAVVSSPFGIGNSINHYATEYQLTDHACFGVYRSDAARALGGWDESLPVNEDVDFDHRLRAAGYRIAYDPEMVVGWRVRERLRDLFKQYRRYGRGKAAMVRKNGRSAIRLRHLAPPTLVAGTVATLLASVVISPAFLAVLAGYGLGVIAIGVHTWASNEDRAEMSLVAMPAGFVATHYGWGLGFIEGLAFGRTPALASGSAKTATAV